MSRNYKKGDCRQAQSLLPPSIDDYIAEDNLVRAIELYVDTLKTGELGFTNTKVNKNSSGQPAFNPSSLLKLYLWGSLNRTRSSRRLEAECYRNLEVMWLMSNLQPCYKTIANFRKDNPKALVKVNRNFILFCKHAELFGGELIGIDSTFIEGNASKSSIYTKHGLSKRIEKIEEHLKNYYKSLDQADTEENQLKDKKTSIEKLATLEERLIDAKKLEEALESSGETQISTTDADARILRKKAGKGPTVGYNLQIAVDDKNKLIATHEVVNDGNDLNQLAAMSLATKDALGVDKLIVLADAGYFNQDELKICEDSDITTYVPIHKRRGNIGVNGKFGRGKFTYDKQQGHYVCPNNKILYKQTPVIKRNKIHNRYRSHTADCRDCSFSSQCLGEKSTCKVLDVWIDEEVIERLGERLSSKGSEMMLRRSGLAEHPFGTLKVWAGWTHFLTRGFNKVRGEMALMITAYNLKRVLKVLGMSQFKAYCNNYI